MSSYFNIMDAKRESATVSANIQCYDQEIQPAIDVRAANVTTRRDRARIVKKLSLKTKKDRMTVQMKRSGEILRELFHEKHLEYAWPIYNRMDTNLQRLRGKYEVIKHPMDLNNIKQKCNKNEYKSPEEFADDIRLIFQNCYKYNPEEHEMVDMARKLQNMFEKSYAKMPDEPSPVDEITNSNNKKSMATNLTCSLNVKMIKRLQMKADLLKTEMEVLVSKLTDSLESKRKTMTEERAPITEVQHQENDEQMSYDEKTNLCFLLLQLTLDELTPVFKIIKSQEPLFQVPESDDATIDIGKFKSSTLRELQAYVTTRNMKKYGKFDTKKTRTTRKLEEEEFQLKKELGK